MQGAGYCKPSSLSSSIRSLQLLCARSVVFLSRRLTLAASVSVCRFSRIIEKLRLVSFVYKGALYLPRKPGLQKSGDVYIGHTTLLFGSLANVIEKNKPSGQVIVDSYSKTKNRRQYQAIFATNKCKDFNFHVQHHHQRHHHHPSCYGP